MLSHISVMFIAVLEVYYELYRKPELIFVQFVLCIDILNKNYIDAYTPLKKEN